MKHKNKNLSPFDNGSDVATVEEKKSVPKNTETLIIDPDRYKKHALQKMDRRFWGIVLATFLFNTILMIYLSNLPYQISENAARRIQEHYANFIYQKQKKSSVVKESAVAKKNVEGKKEESKKVAEQPPAEAKSGGTSAGSRAKGPATAKERVAARSRSTRQISQEVSKKGLLGLLTGTGEAAQGEAVRDVLGNDAGQTSGKNLDKILSNIGGIKTSGASEGVGKGGSGRVRGGRATGAGAAIGDIVTGLGQAQTTSVRKKTKMKLFKSANVKAEAGKSGGRSAQSVLAVINSHKAAIEYCYQRALRTNPNLKGKISVRFVIHPDGSVGKVTVIESTLNNSSVERCIVSKIRRWRDFGPVDPSKGDAVFRQDYIFGY
ncbi:MAG: AgmX/PglI C-terminal domain-containing protein [Calditrichaeota bacterium]|nr:AgmX/PglI C-terminal domain-containing protein [Calditrichota bacterium]